ncbi:MAG: helix-turn-helix domain-containing protein [Filifactoraceae bacterium]
MGVKRQFISNIERIRVMISLKMAFKIAKELYFCICNLFEE